MPTSAKFHIVMAMFFSVGSIYVFIQGDHPLAIALLALAGVHLCKVEIEFLREKIDEAQR